MVQELIVYNDSKFKKNIGISLPHEKEVWKCLFIKNLASAEIAGDKKKLPHYNSVFEKNIFYRPFARLSNVVSIKAKWQCVQHFIANLVTWYLVVTFFC